MKGDKNHKSQEIGTNLKEGKDILFQVKGTDEVGQCRIYPATFTSNGDIDINEIIQGTAQTRKLRNQLP